MLHLAPENLASCPVCGCLVVVVHFADGSPIVWDPCHVDRRFVRSWLPAGTVERQGFGLADLIEGDAHECPPAEDCALMRSVPLRFFRSSPQPRKGGTLS